MNKRRGVNALSFAIVTITVACSATVASGCGYFEIPPKPVSNWTLADARSFDEFPLFWLGESYEGLQLTLIVSSTDGDGVKHASFSYGELSYHGDSASGSWGAPLEIDIQPYCGYSPEEYLSYERYLDPEISQVLIRGAPGYLARYAHDWDYLTMWWDDTSINIGTHKTEFDIEQVARELIPIADDSSAALRPVPGLSSTSC